MTRRAFVIGHPIAHSRSPLIHNYWLRQYGLEGVYEAIDVEPDTLPVFFDRLRAGDYIGGNVTIPLKLTACELCDEVDADAALIGAVNTLSAQNRSVRGSNTDHLGFLGNLDQHAPGWDKHIQTAIVLGAGGAARGVLLALARRGAKRIVLLNRTPQKAEALANELGPKLGASIMPGGLTAFAGSAPEAGLVVNTSAAGMHGTKFDDLDLGLLPKAALVTDIVYTPLVTPLLADARTRGLRTVDGLGMLLHQAVPGFEAWFGVRPQVTEELYQLVVGTLSAKQD
jgi:shikimate dehydrogenase